MARILVLVLVIAAVSALPYDHIIKKLDDGPRFQYAQGPDGNAHYVDTWFKSSDLIESTRFDPEKQIIYHLFTRQNPSASQPLLIGVDSLLGMTNYNAARRTIVLIHGWLDDATSEVNTVLVPAFLQAEDVNVIVVDWSVGASTANYATAATNTLNAGVNVAKFLTWLMAASGSVPRMFHIVGHSLGGHMAGIIGRNLEEQVAYITALDPLLVGWTLNENKLTSSDAVYTEVIHTNAGMLGYAPPLGDVDFYPNGGADMPGCATTQCDHARSYFYFAESLVSGGFTGQRCSSFLTAMTGNCLLWGNLNMGGLAPKTGSSGIFRLATNASPPFSQS